MSKSAKNDLTLESSFSAVRASWELPFKYVVEGDVYFNPCIGFVLIRTIHTTKYPVNGSVGPGVSDFHFFAKNSSVVYFE